MEISQKDRVWGYLNYFDTQYQAWCAFIKLNELRDIWIHHLFNSKKKVLESHNFYDRIFRCTSIDSGWISAAVNSLPPLKNGKPPKHTKDHPFSARVAGRAIMNDNQWLLDDFDIFYEEFCKLIVVVGVISSENMDVKITSDNDGDIIVPVVITERYNHIQFIHQKTLSQRWGLPLDIPDWYLAYEEKKVPSAPAVLF